MMTLIPTNPLSEDEAPAAKAAVASKKPSSVNGTAHKGKRKQRDVSRSLDFGGPHEERALSNTPIQQRLSKTAYPEGMRGCGSYHPRIELTWNLMMLVLRTKLLSLNGSRRTWRNYLLKQCGIEGKQ
ncbi:hypothetical protein NC652_018276 [Populus alba x Populus x berolinensis]|nr:hypothetical protein NC652_018276 [Populus alba x Populus x berolinensis]